MITIYGLSYCPWTKETSKVLEKKKLKYKIILTGGYASLFKKYIKKKTIIDQNVTIKGVIKVYKEFLI